MNKKLIHKRNSSLNLLDRSFNITKNVIKFGKGETMEHFLAKCLLCKELKELQKYFVTEAIFINKSRADIFILDDCEAWEVLGSETLDMLANKSYPCKIISFDADKVLKINKIEVKV